MNKCKSCKHFRETDSRPDPGLSLLECARLCDPGTGTFPRLLTESDVAIESPCHGVAFEQIPAAVILGVPGEGTRHELPNPVEAEAARAAAERDPDILSEVEELRLSITFLTKAVRELASPPMVLTELVPGKVRELDLEGLKLLAPEDDLTELESIAIGWAVSYFCIALDEGRDPRKIPVPEIIAQAIKDLREPEPEIVEKAKDGGVFCRPECPFTYCDQESPFNACLDGCRHDHKATDGGPG